MHGFRELFIDEGSVNFNDFFYINYINVMKIYYLKKNENSRLK